MAFGEFVSVRCLVLSGPIPVRTLECLLVYEKKNLGFVLMLSTALASLWVSSVARETRREASISVSLLCIFLFSLALVVVLRHLRILTRFLISCTLCRGMMLLRGLDFRLRGTCLSEMVRQASLKRSLISVTPGQ